MRGIKLYKFLKQVKIYLQQYYVMILIKPQKVLNSKIFLNGDRIISSRIKEYMKNTKIIGINGF